MNNSQNEKSLLPEHRFFNIKMSETDLRDFGMGRVAYLKNYTLNGKEAYVIHAADGSAIKALSCEDDAVKDAYYEDLKLVAVN